MKRRMTLTVLAGLLMAAGGEEIPSRPEIGAPELAVLGPLAVGTRTIEVTGPNRLDAAATLREGRASYATRTLRLRIWYPAQARRGARAVVYQASASGEPGHPDARFTVPGLAIPNAPPSGAGRPVVVLSHGWGNDPAMMTWLGENLASKGYVIVAPEHRDPYADAAMRPAGLLARPLDIRLVLDQIHHGLLGKLADQSRIALAGYSYGGYGVLTVSGATLDSNSQAMQAYPEAVRKQFGANGSSAKALVDPSVRAVIAIAPAGGAPGQPWGQSGLAGVRAPLLVIAGTADATVGYTNGPEATFKAARNADRYLLAFVGAGHSIGTNPAPAQMRMRLWDFDWFEDPVWRKQRINAISLHFISAFLDWHLKGQDARKAYFAVPGESSDDDRWLGEDQSYAAVSRGGVNPTWLGFVRGHQRGLILKHVAAESAADTTSH